jgi:hypothetical protein
VIISSKVNVISLLFFEILASKGGCFDRPWPKKAGWLQRSKRRYFKDSKCMA